MQLPEKNINILLYLINKFERKTVDFHKLFKILYFADMQHLVKYGHSILNEDYIAMEFGPVPSLYFKIKDAQKPGAGAKSNELKNYIIVFNNYLITTKKEADPDYISESEIECLNNAFNKYKDYDFNTLTKESHDKAWKEAYKNSPNTPMKLEAIAKAGGAKKGMIEYIKNVSENDLELM